MHAVEYLRER